MSNPNPFENMPVAKMSDSLTDFEFFECDGCERILRMPMTEYKTIPEDVVLNAKFWCVRCTKRMNDENTKKRGRPRTVAKKQASKKPTSKSQSTKTVEQGSASTPVIGGLSPEEPITTNHLGGKQSHVPYRFDLVDPLAMFQMCKVLEEGFRKYGDNENWRYISTFDHLNHMIAHAYAYMAGDTSDEHLSHTLCRALFALGVGLQTPEYIEFRRKQIQKAD